MQIMLDLWLIEDQPLGIESFLVRILWYGELKNSVGWRGPV